MGQKLLIVQAAALDERFGCAGLDFRPMQSVFPALTCCVQASFRTALPASGHGMVANGLYVQPLGRPMFWEQSAQLVAGERIWHGLRQRQARVAMLFWQQSLGEQADILLSPAPIHKHHGGMIQDCYSQPAGLYQQLCERLGKPFRLRQYWGPLACAGVGDWIAAATAAVMEEHAPELCLTYLPSLDYDLQRFGPVGPKADAARAALAAQLQTLLGACRKLGYQMLVYGDYAIASVTGPAVLPNIALAEGGFFHTRQVAGMLYPDFYSSAAFAMVDHELAHVYVKDGRDIEPVAKCLRALDGVAEVLDRPGRARVALDHPNSGQLVLIAQEGRWFAYPWWSDPRQGPEFAGHVDIHSKPGFDPCELFLGMPPWRVSQNTARVRGTHGRIGPGRAVGWASTFELPAVENVLALASAVRDWLNQ